MDASRAERWLAKHPRRLTYGLWTEHLRRKAAEYYSRPWVSRLGIMTRFGVYTIGGHPARDE